MSNAESFAVNRAWWDGVVETHVNSSAYLTQAFRDGGDTLHPIESDEIGDVRGKTLVHLQCHFGLDTLSLARRGATVTGLDFAPNAVNAAQQLAAEAKLEARSVERRLWVRPTTSLT